ncbi:hypothetical protein LZ554_001301 [Drepanopeziza brunnea f. sp. 'monogermtubi']|nr:hypothetical protein LZ554_001301 [Drepanopeziza brunnea f. sp. 'monogermtubi']
MKSTTLALGALLVSVVVAQPHRHNHLKRHNKKRDVYWVTDWDYVTETVAFTKTIWLEPGAAIPTYVPEVPASPDLPEVPVAPIVLDVPALSTTSSPPSPSSAGSTFSSVYGTPTPAAPVPVYPIVAPVEKAPEPTPTPTPAPAPAPAPVPAPAPAPVVAPVEVAPVPVPAPVEAPVDVAPAPVVTPTPAYVAPVPVNTPAPAYVPVPAPVVAAPVPAVADDSASSAATTDGDCSSGSPCKGDITYYEAGLGACGFTHDGNVDKVIALPHEMMGYQSNGNPFCGKTVTIKLGDKTVQAEVVDKCMGCKDRAIDLSIAAFKELADMAIGRTQAVWWFN